MIRALFVLLVATLVPGAALAEPLIGSASVIDGDTLDIRGERVRLHAIDAPESGQLCRDAGGTDWRCGQQAALALSDKIGRATVTCETTDIDRYGRVVAICYARGVDLNEWLVAEGWAVAYRQYGEDYIAAEDAAREAGRGIWTGALVMPWDWRRGVRMDDPPPPEGCEIKGNISRSGERIYHVPGQQHYDRTRIDTAAGERWFCSAAEAEEAGWRPARQ